MSSDQKYKCHTPLKVRFDDTDKQGHVYFGTHYSYFDEGIEAYMKAIGYPYLQMLEDNTDFVYAESNCTYKSAAKWPEILNVHTRIGHVGRRSLRFEFAIWASADDRLISKGYIAAVTVNRQTFTPHPVPDGFRQAITAYEDA